jgi:hypothetical protein
MDEERIRLRAYAIWEREARPAGRDLDHWSRACHEIAMERGHVTLPLANGQVITLDAATFAAADSNGTLSRAAHRRVQQQAVGRSQTGHHRAA